METCVENFTDLMTGLTIRIYCGLSKNEINEAQGQPALENPPRLIPVASIWLLTQGIFGKY
jgi:hypothetical protein